MTANSFKQNQTPLAAQVEKAVLNTPVYDIHTHLYDPAFGDLLLWGHRRSAGLSLFDCGEAFRYFDMPYEKFWALSKPSKPT